MKIILKKPTLHQALIGGIGLMVLLIGIVGYIQLRKMDDFKTTNNPEKAREVALSFSEIVGKIYMLPDEIPTIATVTDVKDLPDQYFYKQAENGDKILIFANAQKIILYRPGINKVVDVATVEPATTPKQDIAGTSTVDEATPSSEIRTQPKVIFNSDPAVTSPPSL